MKKVILISIIMISSTYLITLDLSAEELILEPEIVNEEINTFIVNDDVITVYEYTYSNELEQEIIISSDLVFPTIDQLFTNDISNGYCTNGTYWMSCNNVKVYTSIGTGNYTTSQSFYFDASGSSTNGTVLSDVRYNGYNLGSNTQITSSPHRTKNYVTQSHNTRQIEYQMGVRNPNIGNVNMITGVTVKGSVITGYGS